MAVTLTETKIEEGPFTPYKKELVPGVPSYCAGIPSYQNAQYSRDVITAGILAGDSKLLESALLFGAMYQAEADDTLTGAEPGKIPHETPGATLEGRPGRTDYNACDTTALYLIAAEGLSTIDPERAQEVLNKIKPNLTQAVEYILGHIDDDVYIERPPEGATGFCLKVTMWKDSVLPQAGKEEPLYPVVYPSVHFIAARGLLSASRILNRPDLEALSDRMYRRGIAEFMRSDGYVVYRDSQDELVQPSSDELHNLAYIPRSYHDLLPLQAMSERAKQLQTPFGYMCTPKEVARELKDDYHADKVWTQDNGMISYGTEKFGMVKEAAIASSVLPHIGQGQELFGIVEDDTGKMVPVNEHNEFQLWAVATRLSLEGNILANNPWL